MFPIALFSAVMVQHVRRAADEESRRRRSPAETDAERSERHRILLDSISRQTRREQKAIRLARSIEKPSLIDLCDAFDVGVREQAMPDDLCGWIEPREDGSEIVVNSTHAESRRRFTVAHMLGHHYYHRDLFDRRAGRGANADRSYDQKAGAPWWNPAIDAAAKSRANRFAIRILMPTDVMRRLMAEGLGADAIAERLCITERAAALRMEMIGG